MVLQNIPQIKITLGPATAAPQSASSSDPRYIRPGGPGGPGRPKPGGPGSPCREKEKKIELKVPVGNITKLYYRQTFQEKKKKLFIQEVALRKIKDNCSEESSIYVCVRVCERN